MPIPQLCTCLWLKHPLNEKPLLGLQLFCFLLLRHLQLVLLYCAFPEPFDQKLVHARHILRHRLRLCLLLFFFQVVGQTA